MDRTFDRTASLVFIAVGAAFVLGSRSISDGAYGSRVGPDLFPFALGILLILLSLRLWAETFRYPKGDGEKKPLNVRRFLLLSTAAILYGLLLETLGYVLSTFLFLLTGFQVMERGKWFSSILVAGSFSFGVYYVFAVLLKGTLPGFPLGWGG